MSLGLGLEASNRGGYQDRRYKKTGYAGAHAIKSSMISFAIRSRSRRRRTLRRRSVPTLSIQVTPPITMRVSAV